MTLTTLALTLLLGAAAPDPTPARSVRRFALVAGSNEGGHGRVPLRYADTDAEAFAHLMVQLAGVPKEQLLLMNGADRARLLAGFDSMKKIIEARRGPDSRVEVIVYYSGHSDEHGLLLGSERLSYPELRAAIASLPAEVRVAVLDSCSSGALLRTKGGNRVAPFLVDQSAAVKGHAFLTASAADEAAQESDRLGASFFTSALLTGLRGAADSTRDGKVTLSEAYQFAFHETLARTERTASGPQHPAYDLQLVGSGDLVLTDLRGVSAGLVLGPNLSGRLHMRDSKDRLVAELRKEAGSAIELGVEPGTYKVTLERERELRSGSVELKEGARVELKLDGLAVTTRELTASRGGKEYRIVPVSLSLMPTMGMNSGDQPVINYFSLNVYGRSAQLRGFEISVGVNSETEAMYGVQAAAMANAVDGIAVGGQLSGLANLSKDVIGLQGTSLFNRATGTATGGQVSGILNLANELRGIQVGGVGNWVSSEAKGVMAAGVLNYSDEVWGAQVSGVVNKAGDVRGAQLGTVNIARRASLQIGVVNVADESDYPIGLVNVVKNGYRRVTTWGGDLAGASVGVKLGGRRLYSILGIGALPRNAEPRYLARMGIGVHLPLTESVFLDTDLTLTSMARQDFTPLLGATVTTLRVTAGWQVAGHFAIYAGPALSYLAVERDDPGSSISLSSSWIFTLGNPNARAFPGLVVGMQI